MTHSLLGNDLSSYSSSFAYKINLNGYTLFSNQRTYGQFQGAYIKMSFTSFSTLYGCGAYLHYHKTRAYFNNAIYCKVLSNSLINIWSNDDISFTGDLIVTFATESVPSSATITFELYDKYISSSDYARSVVVSTSIGNNPSGVTILPRTNIEWRRMVYKQRRTGEGPVRVTLKNNYQYVTPYNTTSNSISRTTQNAIIFQILSSQSSNQKYKCAVR